LKRKNRKIRDAPKELEQVAAADLTDSNVARQKEIALEIEKLLEQEEIF
jgi:hypothetical protein